VELISSKRRRNTQLTFKLKPKKINNPKIPETLMNLKKFQNNKKNNNFQEIQNTGILIPKGSKEAL